MSAYRLIREPWNGSHAFPTRLGSIASLLLLFLGVGAAGGCATVNPGQVGVLWRASSGTQSKTYGEGLHALSPWNDMYVYDLRSMSQDELLDVIAVNGLGIKLDTSVRYHLSPSEVVALQTGNRPRLLQDNHRARPALGGSPRPRALHARGDLLDQAGSHRARDPRGPAREDRGEAHHA